MHAYIASHCRWAGLHVANVLNSRGVGVTSTWLNKEFKPTTDHTDEECMLIANEDYLDIARADVLVLIAGPDKYSGGKFVEAGIALGLNKTVVILGRRENMLMHHPRVTVFDNTVDLAVYVANGAFIGGARK